MFYSVLFRGDIRCAKEQGNPSSLSVNKPSVIIGNLVVNKRNVKHAATNRRTNVLMLAVYSGNPVVRRTNAKIAVKVGISKQFLYTLQHVTAVVN